jgi:hypothetical protein
MLSSAASPSNRGLQHTVQHSESCSKHALPFCRKCLLGYWHPSYHLSSDTLHPSPTLHPTPPMPRDASPAVNVYLPKDRVTNAHQGYGFVEFRGEEDCDYVSVHGCVWKAHPPGQPPPQQQLNRSSSSSIQRSASRSNRRSHKSTSANACRRCSSSSSGMRPATGSSPMACSTPTHPPPPRL